MHKERVVVFSQKARSIGDPMAQRKQRKIARQRTVVIYREGTIGYYSRDRVEGGMSPTYSSNAILAAARQTRTDGDGTHHRWPAAS